MENLTYDAVLRNPDLLDKLLRDARRERAKAIGGLISAARRALSFRARRPATGRVLQTSACG
jgi:hypothetical protein